MGSLAITGKSSAIENNSSGKINIARMKKGGVTFTPATNFQHEEKLA